MKANFAVIHKILNPSKNMSYTVIQEVNNERTYSRMNGHIQVNFHSREKRLLFNTVFRWCVLGWMMKMDGLNGCSSVW